MLRLSKTLFKAIEGWGGERGEKGSEHSGGSRGWGNGPWEMDTPEKETEDTAEGSESAAVTRSGQSCDSVRGEPVPTATGVASFVVRGNDSHHLRAKTETSAVVDVQTKHKRTSNADNDSERQESTKEREQSEWEQVVKLSNTLVNDFGRLPFARENWEEVHAIPITGGGESDVGKGEDSYDASLNDLPGISDTGISTTTAVSNTNGTGHLADAGNTFGGRMDSLLSAVTKKAEELRAQGNDKFRTGNIDESLCAFSLALDVLKQAESHPSDTIGLTGSIGGAKIDQEGHGRKQEQVCSTLRGVLHRNRAAVLLRMFDRMAEAPGQVQNEVKSPKVKDSPEDFQEANLGIPSVTDGHVYIHRQKVVYTSSDKGTEGERVKVTSTQLLEQCEADCLRALEVDATDKKARFRLVRCRELQQQQQQQANRRAVTATTDAAYTVTDGYEEVSRSHARISSYLHSLNMHMRHDSHDTTVHRICCSSSKTECVMHFLPLYIPSLYFPRRIHIQSPSSFPSLPSLLLCQAPASKGDGDGQDPLKNGRLQLARHRRQRGRSKQTRSICMQHGN